MTLSLHRNAIRTCLLLVAISRLLGGGPVAAQDPEAAGHTADVANQTLRCHVSETAIEVRRGDALVLRYNVVAPEAPDDGRRVYERSGYIHPILSPAGRVISGDFAADHPHQHGLFVAWTDTRYKGQAVDFWNQLKKIGVVLHDRVISIDDHGDTAKFQVAVKHYQLKSPEERLAILDDVWTVEVHLEETGDETPRYVIDFTTAQTNITEHPLTINQYRYGGVGFRGADAWYSDASAKALTAAGKDADSELPALSVTRHRFLTSEGHDRRKGNHSRPDWTMLYGLVDGDQIAGIKMTPDKMNFRYPDPVRLHPNKPYFSISPCVVGAFDIRPGQTYQAKYRFEVFDGKPSGATE